MIIKFGRTFLSLFPFKIRYLMEWILVNRRLPRKKNPRSIKDYFFWEIFLGKINDKYVYADKLRCRDLVAQKGLANILPKLLGVWHDAEHINFEELPEKFVLKCNHGCGLNILCNDKKTIDKEMVVSKLNSWLHLEHPIYYETHMKKIEPVIIGEEFIEDGTGFSPTDYKFHCTRGEVICIQVVGQRHSNEPCDIAIMDIDWNNLEFVDFDIVNAQKEIEFKPYKGLPRRPKNLKSLIEYARKLSEELNYIRIDLYDNGSSVFFGEYTLTPLGGNFWYFSKEALSFLGAKVDLVTK